MNFSKTIRITDGIEVNADADEIFPLLCPVREYDWIKGWKCELLFCPNGKNERGVVFKEIFSSPFLMAKAGKKTKWTTLKHDTVNQKVHFRWENPVSLSIFKIELEEIVHGRTKVQYELTYNVFNQEGMHIVDENTEFKLKFMTDGLMSMIKHYCETGTRLDSSGSSRVKIFKTKLSLREKLTFLHNKMAMHFMRDRDRTSYLKTGRISEKSLYLEKEL